MFSLGCSSEVGGFAALLVPGPRPPAALALPLLAVVLVAVAGAIVILRRRPARRLQRHALFSTVELSWKNANGDPCSCEGMCRNVSSGGLGVEAPQPLPLNAAVSLRVPALDLRGAGIVRHCTPGGEGYLVGIRFNRMTRALARFGASG